jgi:O-antigen/teichoic acid export membrane protein
VFRARLRFHTRVISAWFISKLRAPYAFLETLLLSRPRRNAIANLVGLVASNLCLLVFLPLYLPLLGKEAYGLVGLFSTLNLFFNLVDAGVGAGAVREIARSSETAGAGSLNRLLRAVELIYVAAALVGGALLIAFSPWAARHWLNPQSLSLQEVTLCLQLAGAILTVRFLCGLYFGVLLGLQRQVVSNCLRIAQSLVSGAGAYLVLRFLSATPLAFFCFQLALVLATLFTAAVWTWRLVPSPFRLALEPDWKRLKPILEYGTGMTLTSLFAFALSSIDKIIIGALLPLSDLGAYSIAANLNIAFAGIPAAIAVAAFPRLAQADAQGDRLSLEHAFDAASRAMQMLVLPLGAAAFFALPTALHLWLRDASLSEKISPVTTLLVFGTCLGALCQIPYQMTLAKGFSMYAVYQGLVTVPLALPVTYFSIKHFGLVGSAFGYALINFGIVAFSNPIVIRLYFPSRWLRSAIYSGLCPAVLLMAALGFSHWGFGGQPASLAGVAVAALGAALLSWVLARALHNVVCGTRTERIASDRYGTAG